MNAEPRKYHRGPAHRLENTAMSVLVRAGIIPHSYLLTTRGRRTGCKHSNPVTVVEDDDRLWLVAPYGAVPWVLNARAAGRITLTRRLQTRHYGIREVAATEAGPVLKKYVAIASATRDFFRAEKEDPIEKFEAEADFHPVFELAALRAAD